MNPRYHAWVFAIFKSGVAAILLAAALAPAPARACTPRSREARVRVSFLADSDLASMVKWAKEQTCTDYAFDDSLSERRLAQGVILTVVGRDVGSIFEFLLHTMNLRLKGTGPKQTIVASGPESSQSRVAREREKADGERDRIYANLEAEIAKKDDTHYTITRRGVDAALGNLPSLSRSMRIVPEVKNGKPNGFRLIAIRPGSLLARVGFHNGDLIQAVNGNDISTPEKALETYAKLRTTGEVHAAILREGKPIAIDIKIE
jgi:general secretion pathway protein C